MNKFFMKRARLACLAGITGLMLAACGGGDSVATSAPTLTPLAGGTSYTGTASFGDTVTFVVDDTAKTITVKFVDSHFGLAGSITSAYTADADNGGFVAKAFTGSGSGFNATQLAAIVLRFTVQDGLLNGSLQQIANLRSGGTTLMQGVVSASNRGVANLSALAGTYSFLRERATYNASGVVTQASAAAYGQIGVKADGTFRVCFSQAYSDTCTTQQVATTGTLTPEADQAKYPGAFTATINGTALGRVLVGSKSGQIALFVDEYSASGTGFTTGTWLLQPSATLASNVIDGEWLCTQPEIGTSGAPTGRTLRNYVSVASNTLQTDTIDADITLDTRGGGVGGFVTGVWAGTSTIARVFVPVSTGTVRYVGTASSATGAANISGTCQVLPTQATVQTYLTAAANSVTMVSIGDARPTQPAIGFDQVYYKQGRYRHTATGSVVSTVWQKAFDDMCEDSGQTESTKSSSLTTKTDVTLWKLNDRTTFDCKVSEANRVTTGLKSAVVGPKGLLYLTDGHHTFTSLYEAPNNQGTGATAGGTVKMPVTIKSNDKDLSNAAFWRKMRSLKYVWLKNPDGTATTPAELPTKIGLSNGLMDEPYRSLVYYTRDVGYTVPSNAPEYLEFYWGEWLKSAPQNIKLSEYNLKVAGAGNGTDKSYMQAIRDASTLMVAASATPTLVIGSDPANTAQSMGARTTFGDSDFAALSVPKPSDGKKAGKLAYALEYRASIGK